MTGNNIRTEGLYNMVREFSSALVLYYEFDFSALKPHVAFAIYANQVGLIQWYHTKAVHWFALKTTRK